MAYNSSGRRVSANSRNANSFGVLAESGSPPTARPATASAGGRRGPIGLEGLPAVRNAWGDRSPVPSSPELLPARPATASAGGRRVAAVPLETGVVSPAEATKRGQILGRRFFALLMTLPQVVMAGTVDIFTSEEGGLRTDSVGMFPCVPSDQIPQLRRLCEGAGLNVSAYDWDCIREVERGITYCSGSLAGFFDGLYAGCEAALRDAQSCPSEDSSGSAGLSKGAIAAVVVAAIVVTAAVLRAAIHTGRTATDGGVCDKFKQFLYTLLRTPEDLALGTLHAVQGFVCCTRAYSKGENPVWHALKGVFGFNGDHPKGPYCKKSDAGGAAAGATLVVVPGGGDGSNRVGGEPASRSAGAPRRVEVQPATSATSATSARPPV